MSILRPVSILLILLTSTTAFAQHDPGRNSVRFMANGEMDKALVALAEKPKEKISPISSSERSFVLSMAACLKGDVPAALEHAMAAVKSGLPPERFVAGPREVFSPLHGDPAYKAWIEPLAKPLIHGPMLGIVTDRSAMIWVRTASEVKVTAVLDRVNTETSKLFSPQKAVSSQTSEANDYTAVIEVNGLQADTAYEYSISINGEQVGSSKQFRTQPKAGESAKFSIAFGGGAGFTPQYERMWTTIAKRDVSALLLLGDNVYIDDPTHQLTQHYCYYRRQSQPEWRRLVASTSVYSIYDDHDFGINDCVPGPDIETPEWKRKVWKTFTENWNNPAYGGGTQQPGCWYDFYIGDVHFIMLDCRYYRDLKGGSMLGLVQKKWLLDQLKSSEGKFKVLVSSVPWSPGVKEGSKDTWDGFPEEREEIFSFIESHRISGVLLMGADRHRSDFRKIRRPKGYDLYEVMSSRLTNVHTHGLMKSAKGSEFIMGYNEECSFGLLEFDTTTDDPQVTYRIVNIDDEQIDSRSLKLSQLRASEEKVQSEPDPVR